MKSLDLWREDCAVPIKNEKKAKKADLIVLPEGIEGTNCFNCSWVMDKGGDARLCEHPDVNQDVTKRMCCKWWDNPKVKRSWGKIAS